MAKVLLLMSCFTLNNHASSAKTVFTALLHSTIKTHTNSFFNLTIHGKISDELYPVD